MKFVVVLIIMLLAGSLVQFVIESMLVPVLPVFTALVYSDLTPCLRINLRVSMQLDEPK